MENRPHFKPGAIKYTKGYGLKIFMNNAFKVILILIAIIISMITIYIYVKQPVRYITGDEFVFAKPQHKLLEPGDKVVIVETENYNMFTPIIRSIKPQITYDAEIIAGPYGKIIPTKVDNQYKITYGHLKEIVHLENIEQEYLEKEYIVRQIDSYGNHSNIDKLVNKEKILGLKITK